MSEEEKKAIELLKQEPDYSLNYYKRENAIYVVLNLIEKLQKQIIENLDSSIIFTYINNLEKQLEQEKEKREIAEENEKVLSLDLGDALKELGLPEDTIIADELVLEINNRYISKDKIRAKIEELNKRTRIFNKKI